MSPSASPHAHTNQYAPYNYHEIPYSEHFENALHHILESPPRSRDGITILPNHSTEQPKQGVSVRAKDVDHASLPQIDLHHLPLSIHDSRRVFASPVPGIRLTHPGGYLQGGPGPSPEDQRHFAKDFVESNGIVDEQGLNVALQQHIAQNMDLAKERMRARYHAQQQNARVEKEIKTLMDQREMEVKIETRMKEDARKRRENREHKRKLPAV